MLIWVSYFISHKGRANPFSFCNGCFNIDIDYPSQHQCHEKGCWRIIKQQLPFHAHLACFVDSFILPSQAMADGGVKQSWDIDKLSLIWQQMHLELISQTRLLVIISLAILWYIGSYGRSQAEHNQGCVFEDKDIRCNRYSGGGDTWKQQDQYPRESASHQPLHGSSSSSSSSSNKLVHRPSCQSAANVASPWAMSMQYMFWWYIAHLYIQLFVRLVLICHIEWPSEDSADPG